MLSRRGYRTTLVGLKHRTTTPQDDGDELQNHPSRIEAQNDNATG